MRTIFWLKLKFEVEAHDLLLVFTSKPLEHLVEIQKVRQSPPEDTCRLLRLC